MSPAQVALIKSFILPPGIIIVACISCCVVYLINKRVFIYVFITTIFFYYLVSTPIFSRYIASIVENDIALNIEQVNKTIPSAIVVLGCNRNSRAPEFSRKDSVSACTLVRLRYAAILQKTLGFPIIVSGGSVFNESVSEAELMHDLLRNEFNSAVFLVEDKSQNTIENAKETALLIEKNNIKQVLLVTHAIHMLRAKYSFNQYNIKIIPAPTYFYSTETKKPFYFDFLPSIDAFYISSITFYEIIGYIWVQI